MSLLPITSLQNSTMQRWEAEPLPSPHLVEALNNMAPVHARCPVSVSLVEHKVTEQLEQVAVTRLRPVAHLAGWGGTGWAGGQGHTSVGSVSRGCKGLGVASHTRCEATFGAWQGMPS